MSSCELITIAQAAKIFPIFTESAIRNLISKSEHNGLGPAIQRIRGRVYLNQEEFRKWISASQSARSEEVSNG